MNKARLYISIVICILFSEFINPAFAFEFEHDSLKGQVKSYTQHYYMATMKDGIVIKGKWHASLPYNFEAEIKDYKHLHKKKYYKEVGKATHHDHYYYNTNNTITEKHSLSSNLIIESKEFYIHDYMGRRASDELDHYTNQEHDKNTQYNHQRHEDTLELKHFNHESVLQNRTLHCLNKLKQVCKRFLYDKNGKLEEKIDYIYNSKGLLSYEISYDANGQVKYKKRYHYDHLKYMVLDETIDINGNVIKSLRRDISYDTHGNWIQINHFECGIPIYIIQRNIRYE